MMQDSHVTQKVQNTHTQNMHYTKNAEKVKVYKNNYDVINDQEFDKKYEIDIQNIYFSLQDYCYDVGLNIFDMTNSEFLSRHIKDKSSVYLNYELVENDSEEEEYSEHDSDYD